MGFFDSLAGLFTNQNAQDAANSQIAGLQKGYNAASGAIDSGNAALTSNFNQGANALTSNYTSALQPFLQNYQTGQAGTTAYGNALGLNGPQGNAAATAAFWNNPAIQSQLDIGSQNVLRHGAQTGTTASGETLGALQNLGQQTASQGWQNYISSLQPYLNMSQGAAGGIANTYQGLGSGLAGISTGLGQGINANYGSKANLGYQTETGIGNANANADLAKNSAGANIFNAVMGLGKLGVSGAGGGGGTLGGNLLSSIGSGVASFLPAIFSDVRLKEDIAPVGELYDGTNVYRYRYKGDPVTRIGVMAQEVEKTRPDSVVEIGGFKAVDYGKATDYAANLSRFLEAA